MSYNPAMSLFTRTILDLGACPVLCPGRESFAWISPGGEIETGPMGQLAGKLAGTRPLICHRRWTAARCGDVDLADALDVLELFAFIRPARPLLPSAAGLAAECGLPRPVGLADQAVAIGRAAGLLLDDLDNLGARQQADLAGLALMMGKGGWGWAGLILTRLGVSDSPPGPPDGQAAAIWNRLPEFPDLPPRGEPGSKPVMPDTARNRLAEMLGGRAETRSSQSDYAAAVTQIFVAPETGPPPALLLSEAGTGTGKTLGYLAPASLWAEQNDATVWISTYTRTLQQQIADELSALPASRRSESASPRIVIRKGRENYLCLLNLEEALGQMPGQPANAVALGLMARWAAASPDGDFTGASFPAWLVDLIGPRWSSGLADRRGECIHSACPHYHKCFVEKSVRGARQADIVVANHALVMVQAALNDPSDRRRPSRYIFDEGHHVFDAADSAFSALLSAGEAAEMRSWIRGAEDGRRGRARGLKKRLGELLASEEKGLDILEAACEAARDLPGTGWRARLSANQPNGPAEGFFAELRWLAYQRGTDMETGFDVQTDLWPLPDALIARAAEFGTMLGRMQEPLRQLASLLESLLSDQADQLDSQMRVRLEGAVRGLRRRCDGPLAAWQALLADCAQSQHGRDGFVDWIQIDRSDGRDLDIGVRRHWLDPTLPFAETVLGPAHGVLITSATLRDSQPENGPENAPENGSEKGPENGPGKGPARKEGQGWQMARLLSGADHLDHPALLSAHESPFDYASQTRLFVVTDLERDAPVKTAAAMAGLMQAAGGGGLGLFTAIHRLKSVWPELHRQLEAADLPLYAQHIDQMNLQTLLHLFRADRDSCLMGTDAVRDGVDVPGEALRLICYDRVPWPRPDMLFRARAAWQGRQSWSEHLTRMKLRQAFGRLIRRSTDRGIFVMLDSRLPTRLTDAFPPGVEVRRVGLAEAIAETRAFFDQQADAPLS